MLKAQSSRLTRALRQYQPHNSNNMRQGRLGTSSQRWTIKLTRPCRMKWNLGLDRAVQEHFGNPNRNHKDSMYIVWKSYAPHAGLGLTTSP